MGLTPHSERSTGPLSDLLKGSLAGLVATVPMTAAMELLFRQLPSRQQYPLPPREITDELTEQTGVGDELPEPHQQALAVAAHFGYGSVMGGLYGALFGSRSQAPLMQGTIFGLGVWAGSYLGLLPGLGILKPATEHPMRRNLLMIAAHVVWGGALGTLTHAMSAAKEPDLAAGSSDSARPTQPESALRQSGSSSPAVLGKQDRPKAAAAPARVGQSMSPPAR